MIIFLNYYIYFLIFFFGAVVGSFLNVVSLRYNTGQSIVGGRSKCFNCAKKLKWYELVPLASFFFLRGKCSACKSRISWQYPIVEMLTGSLFLLIFNFQFSIFNFTNLVFWWAIFSLLIAIAVYDYHHQIIPDLFVYLFNGFSLVALFNFENFNTGGFLAGIALFSFFALLWLVSRGRWMGFGDAKLALGIGWMLGLGKGAMAITFSFWIGAVVGVSLLFMAKKRYNMKTSVAFGPFMIMGTFIAFFWGDKIMSFVLR